MATRTNLDMDVLRSFVTGFELGSFARAAERLGRSQSAISSQLRKLEEQAGQPLVQKSGRGLALTAAGESLLGYARRILELNDAAVDCLQGPDIEGWVRLGLAQDFAESWLPAVLGRFARAYPKVRIELQVERNIVLIQRTGAGELDLALTWDDGSRTGHCETVAELPVVWVGRPDWPTDGVGIGDAEPLPLILFEAPCIFRTAALAALAAAGIDWRVAATSPGLAGLWMAAAAGLGVTLRTPVGLRPGLAVLDPARIGLPALPDLALMLRLADAAPSPAVTRLVDMLRETIAGEMAALRPGFGPPSGLVAA